MGLALVKQLRYPGVVVGVVVGELLPVEEVADFELFADCQP